MLNKYKIIDNTLVVYNRKDNQQILFDAEDFDKVSKHTWAASKNAGYVRCSNKGTTTLAHRMVMNEPKDLQLDHINGNKCDNRKANLRIVTIQQNQHNMRSAKGYSWIKRDRRYQAKITINKKTIHLGYFHTEDEARAAYLEAKRKHHPTAPHHLYF